MVLNETGIGQAVLLYAVLAIVADSSIRPYLAHAYVF